jgi:hypothetical protein
MNNTTTISRITLTATILISSSMLSFAGGYQQNNSLSIPNHKNELVSNDQQSLLLDAYLMVMQQQVDKGDQSITYSFYVDQLKDIYKINQLNADIDINLQMIETDNMK